MSHGVIVDCVQAVDQMWGRGPITLVDDYRIVERVDLLCEYAYSRGDALLVIDEIDAYASPTSPCPGLELCLRKGRSRGVSILAASQRPALVPRSVTSSLTTLYAMGPQAEPRDLAYFAAFAGLRPETLQTLPAFSYLVWSRHGGGKVEQSEPLPFEDEPGLDKTPEPGVEFFQ